MTKLACAAIVAMAVAATGCASLHARRDPAAPPLATPTPPPHTIPAVEPDAAPPPPPAANDGPVPVAVRPARRVAAPKHDKPSEKAEAAPPAVVPAPPATPPLLPLQTTANVTEVERNIRARIARATRDLDRTDYRALSTERRTEYDTARRFIHQAEEALKVKNLVFAEQLADKAATLAAALVPR